jgi:hypothetical protein
MRATMRVLDCENPDRPVTLSQKCHVFRNETGALRAKAGL